MNCQGKHTKYQPANEEFKCPKCGKGPDDGGLVIDESYAEGGDDCGKVHDDDYLRCYACGYDTNGAAYVRALVKKKDLVPCPCCNGKGMITTKAAKAYSG